MDFVLRKTSIGLLTLSKHLTCIRAKCHSLPSTGLLFEEARVHVTQYRALMWHRYSVETQRCVMLFQSQCSIGDFYSFSLIIIRKWRGISGDKHPSLKLEWWFTWKEGAREEECEGSLKFQKDGSGSSQRREATHSYHRSLSHADWLAHWCGTRTLRWVSSPGCSRWPLNRSEESKSQTVASTTGVPVTDNLIWVDFSFSQEHTTLQRAFSRARRCVSLLLQCGCAACLSGE